MMMTVDLRFIGLAIVLIAFVVILTVRALRKRPQSTDPAARELFYGQVYREQIGEIEGDLAQGRIDETEAGALRLEVERRLLRADRNSGDTPETLAAPARNRLPATLGVTALVPLAAIVIYGFLGSPELPSNPYAGRQGERAAAGEKAETSGKVDAEAIAAMVDRLAQRLEENPDDPKGWQMLARSYLVLDRPDDANATLAEALRLFPDNKELLTQQALLLIGLATPQGASFPVVPQKAADIFSKILEADPNDMDALWFGGMFQAQTDNKTAAITMWKRLMSLVEEEHEIRTTLERLISDLEKDNEREAQRE